MFLLFFFFFQAEDGIRDFHVTGVQTCALPIWSTSNLSRSPLARSSTLSAWVARRGWPDRRTNERHRRTAIATISRRAASSLPATGQPDRCSASTKARSRPWSWPLSSPVLDALWRAITELSQRCKRTADLQFPCSAHA